MLRQPDRFLAYQNMKVVGLGRAVSRRPWELPGFARPLRGRRNERRARLVNEHTVGFVDDRKKRPRGGAGIRQGLVLTISSVRRERAVGRPAKIAQIVEHQLLVRTVGDVAPRACRARGPWPCWTKSDAEAKRIVDGTELLRITPCRIVVDSDDVPGRPISAAVIAGSAVNDALAGLHLGERPLIMTAPPKAERKWRKPRAGALPLARVQSWAIS
jgi:hypothetical protein